MNLQEALDQLGSSPQEIYANLKTKGIKGIKSGYYSCPVAEYINKSLGCGNAFAGACFVSYHLHGEYFSMATPECVVEFMQDFDEGEYPDLQKKNEET